MHAGWSVDQGGVSSYVAKDEDEEVRLDVRSTYIICMGGRLATIT